MPNIVGSLQRNFFVRPRDSDRWRIVLLERFIDAVSEDCIERRWMVERDGRSERYSDDKRIRHEDLLPQLLCFDYRFRRAVHWNSASSMTMSAMSASLKRLTVSDYAAKPALSITR